MSAHEEFVRRWPQYAHTVPIEEGHVRCHYCKTLMEERWAYHCSGYYDEDEPCQERLCSDCNFGEHIGICVDCKAKGWRPNVHCTQCGQVYNTDRPDPFVCRTNCGGW